MGLVEGERLRLVDGAEGCPVDARAPSTPSAPERDYLSWFYDRIQSSHDAAGSAIDEYARTFSWPTMTVSGPLGARGDPRREEYTI
jgi:hypothetical protein